MKLFSTVVALLATATVSLSCEAAAAAYVPMADHQIVHHNPLTEAHFNENGSFDQGVEIFARHFPSSVTMRRRLLQADPVVDPGAADVDAAVAAGGVLDGASDECKSHLTQVRAFFESNGTESVCQSQRNLFDGFDAMSQTELQTKVEQFCATETGCGRRMRTGFLKLSRFCGDDLKLLPLEVRKFLKLVTSRVGAICSKDRNDSFCLPTIKTLQALGPKLNTDTVTKADLTSSCTLCSRKLINHLRFWLSGDSANEKEFRRNVAALGAVCLKPFRSGDFCYLKFKEYRASAGNSDESSITSVEGAKRLDLICEPCVNAFVIALVRGMARVTDQTSAQQQLVTAGQKFAAGRALLCSKNQAGYCVTAAGAAVTQMRAVSLTCGTKVLDMASCSAGCKAAIVALRSSLGCCFGPIMMFAAIATPTPVATGLAIRNKIQNACTLDVPQSCNRKRLVGAVVVRNLRRSWCLANVNDCVEAIRNDVAARFGVQPESVGIDEAKLATDPECTVAAPCQVTEEMLAGTAATTPKAAPAARRLFQTAADEAVGGLLARVSIETADDDDLTTILTQSVSNLDMQDMTMEDATALPDDAKLDALQEVTVAGQPEVLEASSVNAAEVEAADKLAGVDSSSATRASVVVAAVIAVVAAVLA